MSDPLPHVELYTDGACSGNPGPGGWAFILRHPVSKAVKEASGGERDTTNNRMELMACIQGLSALTRPSRVELYSDSQYVLNGLKEWMASWKKRGWKTAAKQPVKNQDLWEILDELKSKHDLRFHWIRGHSEHPENERCDQLAVAAARAASLPAAGRAGEGLAERSKHPLHAPIAGEGYMSQFATPTSMQRAREMRQSPTLTEAAMWELLRGKQLGGFKFRRQHPIGHYIVDFYCHAAKLVVEIDGESHEGREGHDMARDAWLKERGLHVLRFTAFQVKNNALAIAETILATLNAKGIVKVEE